MARAHAANACVQSDSIKGLAQSIAKPAYHRLLTAEPALRRAVPTLIIAFLVTICLGAFVQVIDQSRQKRGAMKRDLHALSDILSERLDRLASVRQDRAANIERLQGLLPGFIPAWGAASGRHVIITGADHRVLARVPVESNPVGIDRVLDAISTAQLLAAPAQQGVVSDMTLPNGKGALAISRLVKSLPGHVIIVQEKNEPIWGSDAALSVTLSATTGRADPGLRVPLAVNPRPRRRPHQRRGPRSDRHRAQSRPLRLVGLGPVARPDLLVSIDVYAAGT
jgi:two-component system, cell cycle sensor histidine kinase PleC